MNLSFIESASLTPRLVLPSPQAFTHRASEVPKTSDLPQPPIKRAAKGPNLGILFESNSGTIALEYLVTSKASVGVLLAPPFGRLVSPPTQRSRIRTKACVRVAARTCQTWIEYRLSSEEVAGRCDVVRLQTGERAGPFSIGMTRGGAPVGEWAESTMNIIRGACGHDCPDTCSWIVEVRDGTAETLFGDPAHPFTRGTLCAKVNHYLERVYHPDRVLHPLKRVGPKGEARFERVSWDEALADIASRWQAIVDESGAEAILPHSSAGVQGLIQSSSIDRRLFGSMGCSGLDRNICGAVAAAGLKVDDRHRHRHRSRGDRPQPLHRAVGHQHDRHQPALLAARARGAAPRRQARRRRSDPHAHRRGRRLAPADQARQRRGAGAGDDARDRPRRSGRSRLRVAGTRSATTRSSSGCSSTRRSASPTRSACRPPTSSASRASTRRRSRRCCGR